MNAIVIGTSLILICLSVCGQRYLIIALALAPALILPVFNPTAGMRSAVYAQELIVAVGLVPWLLRDMGQPKWGVLPTLRGQWVVLVIYVFFVTAIGYLLLGQFTEIPIRSTLAAIRFSGFALVFIMVSSIPISEDAFRSALRWFYGALWVVLLLAISEQIGITRIGVYKMDNLGYSGVGAGLGMFVRASLGTVAQIGLFVSILLLTIKGVNRIIGIGGLIGFLSVMLASLSRTNVMSTGVFILLYVLFQKGTRIRNLMISAVGLAATIAIVASSPQIAARLGTVASSEDTQRSLESGGRARGWMNAMGYIVSNPMVLVFGSGYDCWQFRLQYASGLSIGHNAFLSSVGELGVIGTILYFGMFYRITKWVWRARKTEGITGKVCTLWICFFISLYIGCLSVDLLYPASHMIPEVYIVVFLMGLLWGRLQDPGAWNLYLTQDGSYSYYPPDGAFTAESGNYAGSY